MNPNMIRMVPLVVLLLLLMAVALGMCNGNGNPARTANLIGHPMAKFSVATLDSHKPFSPDLWNNQVTVLNVFASWCIPCKNEHSALLKLAQSGKVGVYGLAWKDKAEAISGFLQRRGNPYKVVGTDPEGDTTLSLALTGVPETFVINKSGDIVYQYEAPLTEDMIDKIIIPLVDKLNAQ